MSNNPIISLTNGMIADPARRRPLPIDFSLSQGEQIAIIGDNGSGKSLLVSLLTGGIRLQSGDLRYSFPSGRAAYEAISLVEFDDAYGPSDGSYYYQRRWNTTDREAVPTVAQYLSRTPCRDQAWQQELFGMLRIDQLLEKDIILLSSGELRRRIIEVVASDSTRRRGRMSRLCSKGSPDGHRSSSPLRRRNICPAPLRMSTASTASGSTPK